jgi:hypothetical protein
METGISFLCGSSWRKRFDPFLAPAMLAAWIVTIPRLVPGRDSDRGVFVSVAERLLAGDMLYGGVYDNKEPLFYYFVALQLALGPWAEVAAEALLIAIAAGATYLIAMKTASRWTAAAISFIAVPITLTGAFFLPGYTELPGVALVLAAIAASAEKRPLIAGSCAGLLLFLKFIFVPLALLGIGCFVLAHRRSWDAPAVALSAALSAGAAASVLSLRGELTPFIETIRLNIAYSQGSLIGANPGWASLAEHLRRIGPEWLSRGAGPAMLAIILTGAAVWRKSGLRHPALTLACACGATLAGSLLILAITGFWLHHLQIFYIPAIMACLSLTVLIDSAACRGRLPALGIVVAAGYLLGGSPVPVAYAQSFASSYAAFARLSELSPEARRLLSIGNSGTYARFGTNDDQGHALGLRGWKLACPRFHQYYFEPPVLLDRVFHCASKAPALIISAHFEPNTAPLWNAFVSRVEGLLAEQYLCDASTGLRICQRRISQENGSLQASGTDQE